MSESKAKKLRQFYRREMSLIRPKPKWIPGFIWKLLCSIVFKYK